MSLEAPPHSQEMALEQQALSLPSTSARPSEQQSRLTKLLWQPTRPGKQGDDMCLTTQGPVQAEDIADPGIGMPVLQAAPCFAELLHSTWVARFVTLSWCPQLQLS